MAEFILKNDLLTLRISSVGAELLSMMDNRREYMWSKNPDIWDRVSPVLFPFVGGLVNKEYHYEGKTYSMPQHGFARDLEFSLMSQTEDSIFFYLEASKETLLQYPFVFRLEIGYTLCKKELTVHWKVINQDQKTMYFSIGGHPGFVCPPEPAIKLTECFLKFENKSEIISSVVNTSNGLLKNETISYSLKDGLLPISHDLFDRDALVIENHQVSKVSLCTPDTLPYLTVTFDAPLFGIWSKPGKHAPYICIEPWYGRCDREDFRGLLNEREWGNQLNQGECFTSSYQILIP